MFILLNKVKLLISSMGVFGSNKHLGCIYNRLNARRVGRVSA